MTTPSPLALFGDWALTMRKAILFLVAILVISTVSADESIRLNHVNTIKIGPVSDECLSMVKADMDLESKEVMVCLSDISGRTTSLIIGIATCERSVERGVSEDACSTIARQLNDIKQPYNKMMRIIGKKANWDQEEIDEALIGGEFLDSIIRRWYRSDTIAE